MKKIIYFVLCLLLSSSYAFSQDKLKVVSFDLNAKKSDLPATEVKAITTFFENKIMGSDFCLGVVSKKERTKIAEESMTFVQDWTTNTRMIHQFAKPFLVDGYMTAGIPNARNSDEKAFVYVYFYHKALAKEFYFYEEVEKNQAIIQEKLNELLSKICQALK